MNILIISGSPRANSQSARVSKIIHDYINNHTDQQAAIYDISENHSTMVSIDDQYTVERAALNSEVELADALIIVAPEHSGMVPPSLKSFFMIADMSALAHKPALIIGISSGMGGTYPISELRSTTIKNSHLLYIPEHVIIRRVDSFTAELTNEHHENSAQRITKCLQILFVYATLLKAKRAELLNITHGIEYGM